MSSNMRRSKEPRRVRLLETEAADVGMKDVPGTRAIGDRSEITRWRSTDNGELFRALD